MRPVLNRYIPYDAIARWWYLVVVGPAAGLILSLATNFKPLAPRTRLATATGHQYIEGWKEDLLLTLLGLGIACGVIWLLEEIRSYKQQIRDP